MLEICRERPTHLTTDSNRKSIPSASKKTKPAGLKPSNPSKPNHPSNRSSGFPNSPSQRKDTARTKAPKVLQTTQGLKETQSLTEFYGAPLLIKIVDSKRKVSPTAANKAFQSLWDFSSTSVSTVELTEKPCKMKTCGIWDASQTHTRFTK